VMTAHIFNANLDQQYPTTLSYKTITGILREQLGWDGVVFSDAMEMRAITDNYGFEQAIVLAVGAGVDILQYGNDGDDPTLVGRVIETIRQHVVGGAIPESRIDESYLRVQALKKRLSFG
jgi:beta-N-acetylhexosaminidase